MTRRPKILVMTPIDGIPDLRAALDQIGEVRYLPDPDSSGVLKEIASVDALFTNPNKSRVFLSTDLLRAAAQLRVICTASTGTNHIDLAFAKSKGIAVISLTEERETINRISSTAEHAFALFLSSLRKIPQGFDSVKQGSWDYEPFVGRQVSALTVGVIGYGRLGTFFARYAKMFGAKVLASDPYKKEYEAGIKPVVLGELLSLSDVISLHVHVTPETTHLINAKTLAQAKKDLLLINTSRGEIVDEEALVSFLKQNPKAFYATDVLTAETKDRSKSPILNFAKTSKQVLITPHVGGMTSEAQAIAYGRAAELLGCFLKETRLAV